MNLRPLRQSTWIIPGLLATGILASLIIALAADGVWDVFAWGVLAFPLVIVTCAWITSRVFARSPKRE